MIKVPQNPGTAKPLYNKKDTFGVKYDTEKRAKQSRTVRHGQSQNIVRKALIWDATWRQSVTPTRWR